MKKKLFRSILLALLALIIMTTTAYAYTAKFVTITIYKHEDVTTSNWTLHYNTGRAMRTIQFAIWDGSGGEIELWYARKGPYLESSWTQFDCVAAYPSSPEPFDIYYVQGVLDQAGFGSKGDYAVVDLKPNTSCGSGVYTVPAVAAATHELGHVFGAYDHHTTSCPSYGSGRCVMNNSCAKIGVASFCSNCKTNLFAFVNGCGEDLNEDGCD